MGGRGFLTPTKMPRLNALPVAMGSTLLCLEGLAEKAAGGYVTVDGHCATL